MIMKSVMMMIGLFVIFAVLVNSQEDVGPDGPESPGGPPERPEGPPERPFGHGHHRGPDGKRGPPPPHPISILELFPGCANMAQAMKDTFKEMMRDHKIGPRSCRGSDDFHACWRRSMETVRCKITETPSNDCMDQLNAFIQGNTCSSASTEKSSSDE